MMTFFGVLY